MPRTSTITRASNNFTIISILSITSFTTSPYDLLPDGTAIEIQHASSAQAEQIEPSSQHELNAFVVHRKHNHSQGTWIKDHRLLQHNLPPPRYHLPFPLHRHYRRSCQQPQHLQRSLWGQDAHMPSWTTTTPTRGLLQPSCTTSHLSPQRNVRRGRCQLGRVPGQCAL